jgi:predicted PolB exonuclease-like 3'-5' exonuclease
MIKYRVFDIETVPLPSDQIDKLCPAFDPETVKTGNLGEEKAKAKIEKLREEHFIRFYRRAALSAVTGQIAMIGIKGAEVELILDGDEKTMIKEWLKLLDTDGSIHWIGFNCASFDIPFIIRRAWFHGLKPDLYGIVRGRYLSGFFTDLMKLWTLSENGELFPVSLGALAQYFGLGEKLFPDVEFHELLRYKPEQARAYLSNDLKLTWEIAERMGCMKLPAAAAPVSPVQPAHGKMFDKSLPRIPVPTPAASEIVFY